MLLNQFPVFAVIAQLLFVTVFSEPVLNFIQEPITRLVKLSDGRGVLRCEYSPPGAEVHWLYKGGQLPHNKGIKVSDQKLSVFLGKMDNTSRSAQQLEFLNDAYFQCEIRFRGLALVSNPAKLIVAVLEEFPAQPHIHISAIAGNTAVIPCDLPHSRPTVVAEFIFNNIKINRTTGNKHIMPSGDLQIFEVKQEDSGEYMCIAHNPYLGHRVQSKRKIFLHIEEPTESKPMSFIKTPPSKKSVALGINLVLECVAVGYPTPSITWKRLDRKHLSDHFQQTGGNLNITKIRRGDEGTYICEAEDSLGNKMSESCDLEIQETPQFVQFPEDKTIEAGHNLSLTCSARGHPKPSLKWTHNGREITDNKSRKGSMLVIPNINQRHAGIYQCFAINNIGTNFVAALITVLSKNKSLTSDDDKEYTEEDFKNGTNHPDKENNFGTDDHGSDDAKRNYGKENSHTFDSGKRHHKRKHSKVKLIPPSKPEIIRLSNTSVMVRWTAGDGGLPINFFKLQYKEVGKRRTNWMTIDEDIAAHIHSYAVTSLRTGSSYRFRIAAVYSNSDNRAGPMSDKFVLVKDTPMEKPSVNPIINFAEAVSPSAITLQWEYHDVDSIQTDGFFIHYRATHMAGKYLKVSVLGSNTRSHIISHLLPDTGYDIKMQSFNSAGTSDFSNIYTCKTKESEVVPATRNRNGKPFYNEETPSITESISSKNSDHNLIYMIAGVIGGLTVVIICVCLVRVYFQRQSRPQDCEESNTGEESLKIGNGHVSSNGYIAVGNKINININPLSHIDIESTEKPDELEDSLVSNNNEIIRLQTFSLNTGPQEEPLLSDIDIERININSENDKETSVISPSTVEISADLPANV